MGCVHLSCQWGWELHHSAEGSVCQGEDRCVLCQGWTQLGLWAPPGYQREDLLQSYIPWN